MAQSPPHKFGQLIGNSLEKIISPILKQFCEQRGLYLDQQGSRRGARSGKKVTWKDKYGNVHDLDFVIEKDATKTKKGKPVAFIEVAWRRYTKHSRNKAQEIQAAVLPIAELHSWDKPFLGAVLGGVFTKGSLNQLDSVGFKILLFPYETIIEAFNSVNIDARFDESTPNEEFARCVQNIEALNESEAKKFDKKLFELNKVAIESFLAKLKSSLDRIIASVLVIPLYGDAESFNSTGEAKTFIHKLDLNRENCGEFEKFEIIVKYSNGDGIDATFKDKESAIEFLDRFISKV